MEYDPDQDRDDRALDDRTYDDSETDHWGWQVFERFIDHANGLQEYIEDEGVHTPNTWGWPRWMYNVAAGTLEGAELERDTLDAIREDIAAQDEMRRWQMHDIFLAAGYAQLEDDEIRVDDVPEPAEHRKRYPLVGVPADMTAVFGADDPLACIGYCASGTVINEGRVRTIGSAHTDGTIINRGEADYMWSDGGIMINEGDVDSFNGYPYRDSDTLAINYGSAHAMSNGGGVMINFGDTEPEPFRRWDGTLQGLFHSPMTEDTVCINYGEITSDGYDPGAADVQTMDEAMADDGPDDPAIIERKTGMGPTSDGIFIAVEDPDNGLYRDADTVISADELQQDEYTELRDYLEELEDRIGPRTETEAVIAELEAMDPDPVTRIREDIQELL